MNRPCHTCPLSRLLKCLHNSHRVRFIDLIKRKPQYKAWDVLKTVKEVREEHKREFLSLDLDWIEHERNLLQEYKNYCKDQSDIIQRLTSELAEAHKRIAELEESYER